MSSPLRLVFMGTPDFSVPALKALVEAGHQVVCVYSQPPRPSGRGHHVHPSPVHETAETLGIEVRTPVSLKGQEEQDAFCALHADAAVVVAYGLILPKVVIDAPRLGTVNIHASLLPRWRGAAPIQRSILAGDTETGITIMRVEPKLDAGPMLAKQSLTITDQTTASTLHDSLAELGAKMIVPVLDHLNDGSQTEEVQCEDQVTYAAKLDKDEGRIDWGQSAEVLHRKIRALNPWPGVWCTYNGERVKILEARTDAASGPIGQVVGEPLVVACGKRSLAITKLQRAGKAPLSAEELVRGYTIPPGSLFT